MTENEFIDNILSRYETANNLIEGDGGFNIKRGMAHSISGYVEDLFALYIAKKINKSNLQYLVDKVISIRLDQNSKAKSFKPDLMIADDNIMTHYFDLKTNLGWNRHMERYLQEKDKFISQIKGKNAWIRFNKEHTQHIQISENIIYQVIVVFGWNINTELLDNNLNIASGLENVDLQVLYTRNQKSDKYEVNQKAFDWLHKQVLIDDANGFKLGRV